MTEHEITKLLAQRHHNDLFVPQCKNGPTQGVDNYMRLDAWAMAKSWVHPKFTAYEIKISRGDFLQDEKWRSALQYCNEFYWVAPQGLIDPAEIDPTCGLLIVSKNCTRLFSKKRAQYREINFPEELVSYVLMCRVNMRDEVAAQEKQEYWREWLTKKDDKKELGHNVSGKIRQILADRIFSVEQENIQLRRALENYKDILPILEREGLGNIIRSDKGDFFKPDINWRVENALQARRVIPPDLPSKLNAVAAALYKILGDNVDLP